MNAEVETLPHPIATLMNEHRTILAVLDAMERECTAAERSGALSEAFWRRTLLFLEVFDEQLHHDKEEGILFPALERNGLCARTGPCAILRSEHARCSVWRRAIAEAVQRGDAVKLGASVQGFVDLERQHILKENQIMLPLARQLLDAATFADMARAFALRDQAVDPRVRQAAEQHAVPEPVAHRAGPSA